MPSLWNIVFHSILSLISLAIGLYVLIEKKLLIGGRFSPGEVYEFSFFSSIIMAASFFLVSIFIMLTLANSKRIKKACEWILIVALILFFLGAFV